MEKTWQNRSTSKPSGIQGLCDHRQTVFRLPDFLSPGCLCRFPDGKDPDPKKLARKQASIGRYEFEPMELMALNLGILDPQANPELARLTDDLGFDSISVGVTLGYLMDRNERDGDSVAGGLKFGDGIHRNKKDIAYGKNLCSAKEKENFRRDRRCFLRNAFQGVEHSAYLPQTNPGYPFATAGGHMSMRTFLLYVNDPKCQPESVDYWVEINHHPRLEDDQQQSPRRLPLHSRGSPTNRGSHLFCDRSGFQYQPAARSNLPGALLGYALEEKQGLRLKITRWRMKCSLAKPRISCAFPHQGTLQGGPGKGAG